MPLPESVAVIYRISEYRPSIGGHVVSALRDLGVKADSFLRNEEPDDYTHYLYIDQQSRIPKHPYTFWAIDMNTVQKYWWQPALAAYVRFAKTADRVFAAQTDSVRHFLTQGVLADWLPLAASPDYHKPHDEEIIYDAIALYHNCQRRLDYTEALRASKFRQFVGWADGEKYSQWMCRAKCAVNVSRLDEVTLRVFEVMSMGVPLITDRARDLDTLFEEGTHYLGCDSPDEMLEQIGWVIEHPAEARAMADRARAEVLTKHTFYHRTLKLFTDN